jgi:hypothetical protein
VRPAPARQRGFGATLLDEADDGVDDHDAEDDAGIHPFAEQGGDDARDDQHGDQRLDQLVEQAPGGV